MPIAIQDRVLDTRQEIDNAAVVSGAEKTAVLTSRQQEVLQLLAQGFTMEEAGRALHIARRTVAYHKYRIMALFGLENNPDLIRFAMRMQLVPSPIDLASRSSS